MIYSNDLGMSGIYNNQYVFIKDASDNKTIYLYDLKNKNNMGTYSMIEILNNSEISEEMKPLYTSSSYILAVSAKGNNNGNYGILEITNEKAIGKVEFKYESIKKVKDYYLMINVDKSYSIYNHDFKKISNDFEYLEAYDNYYVGIQMGKLNVYRYDNALGILEQGIEVESNKFKVDFTNGIKITLENGETYTVLEGNDPDGE